RRPVGRRWFSGNRYYQGKPSPLSSASREQRRGEDKRQAKLRRSVTQAVGLVIIAGLVYLFGFVRTISLPSSLPASVAGELKASANNYLNRHWYSRLKPLISHSRLRAELLDQFPGLSGLGLELPWYSSNLNISDSERQPLARWQTTNDANSYLVDEQGTIYANPAGGFDYLVLIKDSTQLEIKSGQSQINLQAVNFINNLDSQLAGIVPISGQARSYELIDAPREVRLRLSGQPFFIKLLYSRGVLDQVDELKEILSYLKNRRITPGQYIDLRIPDTAYYR
ncbi:MAG TPA: hypothetical protein VGA08_03315, partial [Candidatus Saccharimonadales bacterium]